MKNREREVVITQGQRPFWQRLVAACLYTLAFYALYQTVFYWLIRWIHVGNEFLELALVAFSGALSLSVITTRCFDLQKKKLKTVFNVSYFSVSYFSDIELDYISVFRKNAESTYEVSLWYKTNKHFLLTSFDEFQPALDFAALLAQKFQIDLLDSTQKGHSKWIGSNQA